MTDSATTASPNALKPRMTTESQTELLNRIEQYKDDHPESIEYWIETEIEAACLLIAMAASLKHLEVDVNNDKDRIKTLRHYAHTYRQVVQKGTAINYLHDLTDEDALSIYGMRIRARRIKPH